MKSKGNAKYLFLTDMKDGWVRKITGGFWNTDPTYPYKPHAGIDYGADVGEVLTAYDDYEVIGVNTGHSDYGLHVFLYFPKIDKTGLYGHMSRIDVKLGQKGSAQSAIGLSGNTGKSGGPHLHFGLANGKVTSTEKGNNAGGIWLDFENYVYAPLLNEVKQDGYIIVTNAGGLNVRKQSSTTGVIARVMAKGERYDYKAYIDINGYRWVTDGSTFVARRSLDNKQVFASAHFANEKPVTPPKPVEPVKPPVQNRIGKILVVTQKDFKKPKFTAYRDKACTIPLESWTMKNYNYDLTFYITEDNDPVFKCVQWSDTPLNGVDHVYIKWESGIRFDNA